MPQPHSLSPSPLSKAEGSAFCLSSWPGLNAWQLLVPGRGQCTQPRGAQADGPAVPVRTWTEGQHRASGRAAWCVPLCPLPHQLALQGQAAGSQPTGKGQERALQGDALRSMGKERRCQDQWKLLPLPPLQPTPVTVQSALLPSTAALHVLAQLPKTSPLGASAFLPGSEQAAHTHHLLLPEHAVFWFLFFFLSKFLLNACFAITSVRNQHERKGGIVLIEATAAEHQGFVNRGTKAVVSPA